MLILLYVSLLFSFECVMTDKYCDGIDCTREGVPKTETMQQWFLIVHLEMFGISYSIIFCGLERSPKTMALRNLSTFYLNTLPTIHH